MQSKLSACLSIILYCVSAGVLAQNIIEDQGIGLSQEEVEFIVKYWPAQMQQAAADDPGDRIELLNRALASKKVAAEADGLRSVSDPDLYWKHKFAIRNTEQQFVYTHYMRSLQMPDMTELAAERYLTEKDRYALVPEERLSSHILIPCTVEVCGDPTEKRLLAEKIHAELLAGANFEELVLEYSGDRGSKKKKGRFGKWLKKGEPNVSPPYIGGVYSIEEVGGYSAPVTSQFGYHIIRLDGIREAHYKSYEEVKDTIIATLQGEYGKLAGKEFEARYRMSEEVVIDNAVLDKILAPYRSEVPAVTAQPVEQQQGGKDAAPSGAEASPEPALEKTR
jgi:peptidyl-prolyl cis-trans isomerase C